MWNGCMCICLLVASFSLQGQSIGELQPPQTLLVNKPVGFVKKIDSGYSWKSRVNESLSQMSPAQKKVVRQFVVDSPFGRFNGSGSSSIMESDPLNKAYTVKKSYTLMLCLTGIGFRIDL